MYKRYLLPFFFGLPLIAVRGNTGFSKTSTDRSTLMDEVDVSETTTEIIPIHFMLQQ